MSDITLPAVEELETSSFPAIGLDVHVFNDTVFTSSLRGSDQQKLTKTC